MDGENEKRKFDGMSGCSGLMSGRDGRMVVVVGDSLCPLLPW